VAEDGVKLEKTPAGEIFDPKEEDDWWRLCEGELEPEDEIYCLWCGVCLFWFHVFVQSRLKFTVTSYLAWISNFDGRVGGLRHTNSKNLISNYTST
jgi:hypothetical protein